jgi:MATE family multidrug resistance protein
MAGLTLGILGALLTAAVLLAGRPLILAAYTDNPEVAAVATTLLAVLPLFHLFDSMQCINSYLLRAYKVAVVPLLLQVVALAGVGLDGVRAILVPGSPQGAGSMWLMAMVGLGLSAALLHYWYRRIVRGTIK